MSKESPKKLFINILMSEEIQMYNVAMLRIVHNLEREKRKELEFFYKGRIPREIDDTLDVLRTLENSGIISLRDVRSLKEALIAIQRLDLENSLTTYEIKRDLSILLYYYASMRQGLEPNFSFPLVESLAEYLVKITTDLVRDAFDKQYLTSLMESKKTVAEVLIGFEKAIKDKSWNPWSELTFLVVIAGETVAEALKNEEHGRWPEAAKLCLRAAEILCSRLVKLGSWEDFGDFVEERHNAIYHQQGSEYDATGKCVEEKVISEVVQQLEETKFFC